MARSSKAAGPCACGYPKQAPLAAWEIESWSKIRLAPICLCPLCGHEVEPLRTAHDVRKLARVDGKLAHKACVKAQKSAGATTKDPR